MTLFYNLHEPDPSIMSIYSDFNDADPGFYNYVHSVIDQLDNSNSPSERRQLKRHAMTAYHRIAIFNGTIPPPESFSNVLCYDLSTGGFSFFMPLLPTFKMLVVAFDMPDQTIYLKAKVAHSENVMLYPSGYVEHIGNKASHSKTYPTGAPTPMILVGCQFLERLQTQYNSNSQTEDTEEVQVTPTPD